MTTESESSNAPARTSLPGARWALALGGFLLAGFLIVVVCAAIDRGHRANLETVSQFTAVGDKALYSMPPNAADRSAVAVRFAGRPLVLVSPNIVGLHDSEARRVSTDSATGISIYVTEDGRALSVSERGNTYLLKVEAGKYVKVQRSEEGK